MANINYGSRSLDGVTKITTIKAGFSPDALIDGFISPEDVHVLYNRYSEGVAKFGWDPMYEHPGNQFAITCEQVMVIDNKQLVKVFGKALAGRLSAAAEEHTQVR